jgi:hypothetical protein
MTTPTTIDSINIRPGVSVLSVLSHLNYRPWFALAEFVDNAIQSFLDRKIQLRSVEGENCKLRVSIEISSEDGGRITIRDNAAGIASADFPRAFRPAQLPPNRTGLCEFGMGMKSAACWFAPNWSVRTSALGESVERVVSFDIEHIVRDSLDELVVSNSACDPNSHFTEIILEGLHHTPMGRTVGKVRSHLQDIYRIFIRDGILELRLNGDNLMYEPPEILVAPHFRTPNGDPITWRQEFDFDFGDGLRAFGFAAIRKKASTSQAGFALFRRNRLIQGSGDEGYRPEMIFGKPNTFAFQRVFGEIHLEGFQVSHTKDGFQWDENEQPFLEFLREELTKQTMPLLQQAREYRVERSTREFRQGAQRATQRTSETLREHLPPAMDQMRDDPDASALDADLPEVETASHRVIDVELHGQPWRIILELSTDPAVGDWLEISDGVIQEHTDDDEEASRRVIGLRLSLVHPFMQRFCGTDCEDIEPLLRVAAALGLAEIAARDAGVRQAGTIRRNVNELLRNALHQT